MTAAVHDGYLWGLAGKPQTRNPYRLTTRQRRWDSEASLHYRWLREWQRGRRERLRRRTPGAAYT